ncbi:MAG: hypothetical protein JWN50_794 [Parcubacteria group bacterium]|nr:hypothetical protein [Parcubacteria group bacterium]
MTNASLVLAIIGAFTVIRWATGFVTWFLSYVHFDEGLHVADWHSETRAEGSRRVYRLLGERLRKVGIRTKLGQSTPMYSRQCKRCGKLFLRYARTKALLPAFLDPADLANDADPTR